MARANQAPISNSNPSLRILHLGKYFGRPGGIETALRLMAEAGAQLGYAVTVWAARSRISEPVEEQAERGITVRRFFTLGVIWSTPLNLGIFSARFRSPRILHVHLPHPLAELRTLLSPPGNRTLLIPYLHALPVRYGRIGRLWFRVVTEKILRRASKILISNEGLKTLVPELARYTEKIRILPFATPCLEESERQRRFADRETARRVVVVGRMVRYKGYNLLLSAWRSLLERRPDLGNWELVLAGEGPELESLREWSRLYLTHRPPTFLGECTETEKWNLLKTSTLFVLSSTTTAETFGISLLEAFGAGLPAIVSDLPGGVRLLGRDGECGAIFSPNSHPELESALERLMDSPEKRNTAGRANLAFASENFSESHLKESYANCLSAD